MHIGIRTVLIKALINSANFYRTSDTCTWLHNHALIPPMHICLLYIIILYHAIVYNSTYPFITVAISWSGILSMSPCLSPRYHVSHYRNKYFLLLLLLFILYAYTCLTSTIPLHTAIPLHASEYIYITLCLHENFSNIACF